MLWLKFTGCLADASQDLWLLVLLYQNRVFLWLSAWQCEGHEVFGDAIAEIITGGVFCKKTAFCSVACFDAGMALSEFILASSCFELF